MYSVETYRGKHEVNIFLKVSLPVNSLDGLVFKVPEVVLLSLGLHPDLLHQPLKYRDVHCQLMHVYVKRVDDL